MTIIILKKSMKLLKKYYFKKKKNINITLNHKKLQLNICVNYFLLFADEIIFTNENQQKLW